MMEVLQGGEILLPGAFELKLQQSSCWASHLPRRGVSLLPFSPPAHLGNSPECGGCPFLGFQSLALVTPSLLEPSGTEELMASNVSPWSHRPELATSFGWKGLQVRLEGVTGSAGMFHKPGKEWTLFPALSLHLHVNVPLARGSPWVYI